MEQKLPGVDSRDVHGASADILGTLVKKVDGDPKALEKLVGDLQRDPAALEQMLTPEQRAKIRELATQIQPPMKSP